MAFGVKPKFTVKGKQLAAAAGAGQASIRFTRIQMGDGAITTQAVSALTALINPVVALPVTGVSVGSNYAKLQTDFSNAGLTEGFYWREVGVFAEDPDTGAEILYCYANCGELAEYISSAGEHSIRKIINVSAIIGDAENVTAEITDDTYYSPLDQLQEDITEEDLIPFFASLTGKKNILFKDFCEAIGVNIGMADFSSHILNKNNPHNVTKKQIGLEKAENTADSEKSVKYAVDADTVDGKHASFFAPSSNPTIDGTIKLTRSNATSDVQVFAYGNGFRVRVTDPNAEAETLTDLIVTPTGIYKWGKLNGVGLAQTNINDGGNAAMLENYTAAGLIKAANTATLIGKIDLNTLIVSSEIGLHKVYQAPSSADATGCTNTPTGAALNGFTLIVFGKRSISTTDYSCTQILIDHAGVIFKRNNVNGTWGAWSKTSDLTLGDINGNKPIVTSILSGNGAIRLGWTPIEGATAYAIRSYASGTWTVLAADITNTNYTVSGLVNNQTYYYAVQAKVNGVWSEYTTADLVAAKPRANMNPPTYFAGTITTGATAKYITTGSTPKAAIFLSCDTEYIGNVTLTTSGQLYMANATFTSTGITIEAQEAMTTAATYKYLVIC